MVVNIEIDNIKGRVVDRLNINQLTVIQDTCSFVVENSEFKAMQYRNRSSGRFDWDGRKKLFNTQTQTFPIGLLGLVVKMFNCAGIDVNIINKRVVINDTLQYEMANFQHRDYQTYAVMQSIIYGNGIVKVATGGGKTTIAARTIGAINKKSIFVVHTRDLLYQTIESFSNIFPNEKIGIIGDGKIDYQNITVATMQSLSILGSIEFSTYKYDEDSDKYEEKVASDKATVKEFNAYRNSVSVVMFDEVQRICSRTAFAARFLFEKANHAFGYSASPWRDDGSDLMIEAAFGSRIVDISASQLIREGYLVRPIITVKRLTNNVWSGNSYEQVYKSAIVQNVFRNMQIVQDAYEQYELGRNTLVLVTQIKHGEILESMLKSIGAPATFISGKSGMKYRSKVIKDMRNGDRPIVIASTIADVGLDVPRLQSIVEAGAGKSSVTALQRLGRIMRPFNGKELCYYITYEDTAPYLNSQIGKKIDIWSTESEFIINRER